MKLKSLYYKLSKNEFDNLLDSIKKHPETMYFFKDTKYECFYYPTTDILSRIVDLNNLANNIDHLFKTFSSFGQIQILQTLLIEEIESTNKIENIYSTRHDIFYLLNEIKKNIKDDKELSIINAYRLLVTKSYQINNVNDIREIYDTIFCEFDDENLLDGKLFRKDPVYINDGINNIHTGFYPENDIIDGLNEFIKIYNSNIEIYLKMIISHFLLENIHPFYDGNGRFGRFMFSNGIQYYNHSITAFLISKSLSSHKANYYKALSSINDIHEFKCINNYAEMMLDILIDSFKNELVDLSNKSKLIFNNELNDLSKNEQSVYKLLNEGSHLSFYGISIKEMLSNINISKRSLMYTLNKLDNLGMIEKNNFNKIVYYKIKY